MTQTVLAPGAPWPSWSPSPLPIRLLEQDPTTTGLSEVSLEDIYSLLGRSYALTALDIAEHLNADLKKVNKLLSLGVNLTHKLIRVGDRPYQYMEKDTNVEPKELAFVRKYPSSTVKEIQEGVKSKSRAGTAGVMRLLEEKGLVTFQLIPIPFYPQGAKHYSVKE